MNEKVLKSADPLKVSLRDSVDGVLLEILNVQKAEPVPEPVEIKLRFCAKMHGFHL